MPINHVSQHAFKLKQPENVVTLFLPSELKFNATPTQEKRPVRNAWLFIRMFNRFNRGEPSMLGAAISKMFHLCMFADTICMTVPEVV